MNPAPEDLLRQAQLVGAIGAAQARVLAVQGSGLPARIAAASDLCARIEALLAHEAARHPGGTRGTVEMAVNEYATLADLRAAAREFDASDAAFDRGRAVAAAHGDAGLEIRVAIDRSFHLARSGRPAAAITSLLDARDRLTPESATPAGAIDPGLKLGSALAAFFRWLGDFERCAELLAATRQRLAETAPPVGAGPADRLLARLKAIDLDNEAMMLALDRAEALEGEERTQQLQEAERRLDALEPIYAGLGTAAAAAMSVQRCRLRALQGRVGAALRRLDELLPVFKAEPLLQQKLGMLHIHRSRWLLASGGPAGGSDVAPRPPRHVQALADAEAGVKGELAHRQTETVWKAHAQLARALRAQPRLDVAAVLAAYDDAIASLDGIRTATLGFRLDNLALRATRPVVDEAVAFAAWLGDAPRAARYADAVKSRFLALALAAGPLASPDAADVEALDRLGRQIDAAETPADAEPAIAERARRIERMRLEGAPPVSARDRADDPLPGLLQGLARRRQAALQLFLANDVLTAVLFVAGRATVRTMRLGDDVRAALDGYEKNLLMPETWLQHGPSLDPLAWELGAERLVPADLLEAALEADSLLVSPHGRLHLLPWAALPWRGGRLFDRLPVGVVPNLASIELLARRPPATGRIALIGDCTHARESERLDAAGPELEVLAALYGPERLVGEPRRAAGATLAAFRTLVAEAPDETARLHLACHGEFLPADPAGAALRLTDRRLTAAEIGLRPLRFGEVTLSACSTGLRPTRVAGVELLGDDLLGLPSSFLEAGASTVLASIAPVNDAASAAFLVAYHRRRIDGVPPLHAFAATQRERRDAAPGRLHDWIGFFLMSVR